MELFHGGVSHGFDLSGDRRPGDRSVRDDDRYLFLESIWCARDFLYLSYVGQSIHHNQKIPPSLVINELLDGIDKLVEFDQTDQGGATVGVREMMINHHTLQPFAEENFKGEKLQDHSLSITFRPPEVLSESRDEIHPFEKDRWAGRGHNRIILGASGSLYRKPASILSQIQWNEFMG